MKTRRRIVLTAAVVGTFLASLDVTVVGTAMPTIIGQLGGLAIYPWVFSIYLLASVVTLPLYGKGADLFGRKPVYLTAVVLFVAGSLACATATSMTQLILWRGLQGLGAGGVLPVTLTIVGDLYPAEQRARLQGLFSGAWALSSIAGPAIGALVVELWTWPWIFLINLPFGAAAGGLMLFALRETVDKREHSFDVGGALALSAATALLMWALLHGGDAGFGSGWVLAALACSLVLAAAFVVQERHHPEPMIPPALFGSRIVAVGAGVGLFAGGVTFGVTSYVPTFVQGVLGGGPASAGAAVLPLGIGWPMASTSSGWLLRRLGYRPVILLGGACLVAGGAGFFLFDAGISRAWVMVDMFVVGLGMGFSAPMLLIAAQESVPWKGRGAATALIAFSRHIGGAVAVAAMGAVLSTTLRAQLGNDPALVAAANALLDPRRRGEVPPVVANEVGGALGVGLLAVLSGIGVCAAVAAAGMLFFPRGLRARREEPAGDPNRAGFQTNRTV
jgi:EmrB/QacA subfamily drug resistance transporter